MEFRTVVALPNSKWKLYPGMKVLFVGSCFAQEMGKRMADTLPEGHVVVNPNGVMYNPASISYLLNTLVDNESPRDKKIFLCRDGLWRSWMYAGKFAGKTKTELEQNLRTTDEQIRCFSKNLDLMVVTWGTPHVYSLCNENIVVCNCHKELSDRFKESRLTIEEITSIYCKIFQKFHAQNPKLRIIITVSPYRYAKLGYYGSNLGKAVLLLAAEQLCQQFNFVSYFPAYEILKDELRDYRFYASDMLHPSDQAVDYIWERFQSWCFSSEMLAYALDKWNLNRAHQHRVGNKESEEYSKFQRKLLAMESAFIKKWG